MSDYYDQYRQDFHVGPWGEDRADLEMYALITSWGEIETARDLLQFPDDAWMRLPHRAAARSIRRLVTKGVEPDPLMVSFDVKQHEPDMWADVERVREIYNANIMNLGALQRSAIHLLKREYTWEMGVRALQHSLSGARNKDYEEWHRDLYAQVVSLAPGGENKSDIRNFAEICEEEWAKLENPDAEDPNAPISSGFEALDKLTGGGFRPFDNVLVVGAPGHGKTTYMFQQSVNFSMDEAHNLFLSLEMKRHKMTKRALAQSRQVAMNELRYGRDVPLARKHLNCYRRIWFSDKYCKLGDFVARAAKWKYRKPETFALFTDYFGSLQEHGGKNPVEHANQVADAWFETAKRLGYCSFMGAQPTKNDYRKAKRPDLSFIRETGKLEQHADLIIWIHCPHEFDNSMPAHYAQFWVLKNREGPSGKIVHVRWDRAKFTMKQWVGKLPDGIAGSDSVEDQKLQNDDNFASLQQTLEGVEYPI